tara:strand:+ start:264 stop:899 length:636 start_codon:yes stop_codon:yes gene_type:complete
MKYYKYFIGFLLIMISCSVPKVILKTHNQVCAEMCIGYNKGDIIENMGPADRKTEDGRGGEILVYNQESVMSSSENRTAYGFWKFSGTPGSISKTLKYDKKIVKEMAFYINDDKHCYRLRTEGYDFTIYQYGNNIVQNKEDVPLSVKNVKSYTAVSGKVFKLNDSINVIDSEKVLSGLIVKLTQNSDGTIIFFVNIGNNIIKEYGWTEVQP